MALLTYTLNVYPQCIQIIQIVDPFVKCIMEGALTPISWPVIEISTAFERYKQQDEKECYLFNNKWKLVEPPKGFIRIISI